MLQDSRRGLARLITVFSLSFGLALAGFAVAPGQSWQAEAAGFPNKPVQLIVPYRAGGGTDTMARVFAKALSKELGRPVPVVNHKGGGGAVGGSRLKNSKPDGYTILMGGDDIATYIPLVSEVDFAFGDFRFLAAVAEYQNAMYAKKGAPFTTFEELAAYAKDNPGIRLAHVGGITKPFMDRFVEQSGIDAKVIATGGGSEIVQLLLGDQIDAAYSGGVHNKNPEQWVVLGSFNANRLASAPDKPTFKEAGYELAMPAYVMFMTPAGVPDDVAATLEAALLKAAKDEDFLKIVEERLKAPALAVDSAELTDYMTALHQNMKAVFGN
jgi:tripartite-type tricarboxylate transporter receptor subunit TctC